MRWLHRWADASLQARNLALEKQSAMRGRMVRLLAAKLAAERREHAETERKRADWETFALEWKRQAYASQADRNAAYAELEAVNRGDR